MVFEYQICLSMISIFLCFSSLKANVWSLSPFRMHLSSTVQCPLRLFSEYIFYRVCSQCVLVSNCAATMLRCETVSQWRVRRMANSKITNISITPFGGAHNKTHKHEQNKQKTIETQPNCRRQYVWMRLNAEHEAAVLIVHTHAPHNKRPKIKIVKHQNGNKILKKQTKEWMNEER